MTWAFILLALAPSIAFAQLEPSVWLGQKKHSDAFIKGSGYAIADEDSAAEIVATVIEAFLGLLGLIFVILIIMAGYNWMTASGDAAKIDKAKQTMTRAIIGLVIIVSAYAITYFVFQKLDNASSVGGSGGGGTGGTGGTPAGSGG